MSVPRLYEGSPGQRIEAKSRVSYSSLVILIPLPLRKFTSKEMLCPTIGCLPMNLRKSAVMSGSVGECVKSLSLMPVICVIIAGIGRFGFTVVSKVSIVFPFLSNFIAAISIIWSESALNPVVSMSKEIYVCPFIGGW